MDSFNAAQMRRFADSAPKSDYESIKKIAIDSIAKEALSGKYQIRLAPEFEIVLDYLAEKGFRVSADTVKTKHKVTITELLVRW